MHEVEADIVVAGAGVAGSAAAAFLARAGRKVAVVEARAIHLAGPRWVNYVPPWMFAEAGIDRPIEPELLARDFPLTAVSATGKGRIHIPKNPAHAVDMRRLIARLHAMAEQAGARFFGQTRIDSLEFDGDRPAILIAQERVPGQPERTLRLRARAFADATGLHGALLRRHRELSALCPPVARRDICTAAQEVRRVAAAEGALRFLDEHGVKPSGSLAFMGVAGGFSTLSVQVDANLGTVDLLAGGAGDGPSGRELLRDFIRRQPWIGELESGGAAAIPLRHPHVFLAAPGLFLLGDTACQVFSAHGSGVGMALIAARTLADALAGHDDPGSPAAAFDYSRSFHRRWSGVLAAMDIFRRAAQGLTGEELARLMESGLVTPRGMTANLDQRPVPPTPADLWRFTGALLRGRGPPARFLRALARAPLAGRVMSHPPAANSHAAWNRFARRVEKVSGETAEG
ncbi:MAG: hypothetical protein GMKNLPBB_02312 [Myxococcota bacterium]|nr:hypothetical protein [Myxococcota bacterium]